MVAGIAHEINIRFNFIHGNIAHKECLCPRLTKFNCHLYKLMQYTALGTTAIHFPYKHLYFA